MQTKIIKLNISRLKPHKKKKHSHLQTLVQLIHGALYSLTFETCSKIHCKVAPSFPGSQVCNEGDPADDHEQAVGR